MNIAVLKYQFVDDKPTGIPNAWPAQTIELGDSTDLPGNNWVLMTQDDYDQHILDNSAAYIAWETIHYATPMSKIVYDKISASIAFGNQLLIQFATENVLMGITQSGKTITIITYLSNLRNYITSGSLYAAIAEIDNKIADPDLETNYAPFLTVARLTLYRQKITTFLGI